MGVAVHEFGHQIESYFLPVVQVLGPQAAVVEIIHGKRFVAESESFVGPAELCKYECLQCTRLRIDVVSH